jgi:response regulator RpfG family c-di-GMP phosphodiesterase
MSKIHLIVCERNGHWAAALRRRFAADSVRLLETRTIEQCRQVATEHPSAIVVFELTEANTRSLIVLMRQLEREFPNVRPVVVADRHLADFENLMREAGVVHFVVSPRAVGDVAELVARRAAELTAAEPAASESTDFDDPRPAILARLPWSDVIG